MVEGQRKQRLAAYAVVVRHEQILLSRLAEYLSGTELWTLPGGGVEFGEHPRDAVIREVEEETGLPVTLGDRAWVDSVRRPPVDEDRPDEVHSVRLVYDGWVPVDAPEPRVVEVDGTTVDARWHRLDDVLSGAVPTVPLVRDAVAAHLPARRQRLGAYALVRRVSTGSTSGEVLLTRISPLGVGAGSWTLPGGGVAHGESPAAGLAREIQEECGVTAEIGALLDVHDVHFIGTAPNGRAEDFHGVHLIFEARVPPDADLRVVERDGTTDAVAWVPVREIESGALPVLEVVTHALGLERQRVG
ncbi:MAG TPA: NUDIX domain-containing protein [Nocardioidaceae bacterium]|nr:NUDIX domain-containing protein [Nocardioidaceae bacterium]